MVTENTKALRPPTRGMKGEELERWYFEVYRKIQELEAEIKRLSSGA